MQKQSLTYERISSIGIMRVCGSGGLFEKDSDSCKKPIPSMVLWYIYYYIWLVFMATLKVSLKTHVRFSGLYRAGMDIYIWTAKSKSKQGNETNLYKSLLQWEDRSHVHA